MKLCALLGLLLLLSPEALRVEGVTSRSDMLIGYREFNSEQTLKEGPEQKTITLTTRLGLVEITLRPESAPQAVKYMKELVQRNMFTGCDIYRAEPSGPTLDDGKKEYREGYALVQGGAYSCGRQQSHDLPVERGLPVRKWTVALITGTSEFFFSLGDHPEWDGAFSIWGEVLDEDSRRVLEEIAKLPTKQELHPSGTVLRILVTAVPFDLTFDPKI